MVGNHTCDENAICTNTDGSYTCKCHIGYAGDGYNCTYGEGSKFITEITEREFHCLWCGLLYVVINFLHTSGEHADDMIARKFSLPMSKNLSNCIIIYIDMVLSRTCLFHKIESGIYVYPVCQTYRRQSLKVSLSQKEGHPLVYPTRRNHSLLKLVNFETVKI